MNVLRFSLLRSCSISLKSFASIVKPMWCFMLFVPLCVFRVFSIPKSFISLMQQVILVCLGRGRVE